MMNMAITRYGMIASLLSLVFLCALETVAYGHCDTLDGPVVITAKAAFEKGDVTPVLKWVKPEYEEQIKELFTKTLAARNQGAEAKEIAETYFFETLVRLHREGEGAAYTGIKPAGAIEPIVALADTALQSGSPEQLLKEVSEAVAQGIKAKFAAVLEKKKTAEESIDAGREYVEAYVIFMHYVEGIHKAAARGEGSEHTIAHEGESVHHHE